jgi:tRNA(Ile)-lysidine synthase
MQTNPDILIKEAFPVEKSPETVMDLLRHHVNERSPIAIACSGGVDSVFLVRWILAHFPKARELVTLLHFNHKTRSEDSDEDEAFVKALGGNLHLHVIAGSRKINLPGKISEEELRDARIAFLHDSMNQNRIKTLLTGHHVQDKVETLLMRLSRGSTLDGLVAPAPFQLFRNGIIHLRPLIQFNKPRMIETLLAVGQDWREDASNQNNDYYRNYIRNKLLPGWKQACPQKLYENIGRSCSLLQDDSDALNKWAASTVDSIELDEKKFPLSKIKMLPVAIQRRCLWMWFNRQGISENLSLNLIESLLDAAPKQSFNLSKTHQLSLDARGDLLLEQQEESIEYSHCAFHLSASGPLFFPDQTCLRAEIIPASIERIEAICTGQDDPDTVIHLDVEHSKSAQGLTVMFWHAGMQYQPLGLKHRKKLQDCFVDRKIPQNKRNRLPVIINTDGEILWVPGLLPAETSRITTESKSLLRLTYLRS